MKQEFVRKKIEEIEDDETREAMDTLLEYICDLEVSILRNYNLLSEKFVRKG